jgi:hypothetical protein
LDPIASIGLDGRALLASTPCIEMLNATPELMVLLRLAASCCSMPESLRTVETGGG